MQASEDDALKRQLQTQFEKHSAILKEKEKRLDEFCADNDLFPENDRVRVVGFGKSVSQKAVYGNKKYLAKKLDKSIIDGTIDSKEYSEMLKARTIVDSKDLKNGLPIKGKAHSIVDMVVDGKVSQRRIYGADGKALIDIDTHDHNRPDLHPTGAHKQVFNYKKKNPHGKPTGFTDQELTNNSDIIQKGVNYRDPK